MSELTKSQIEFLEHHGIDINLTFDAKGLKKSEYANQMKINGRLIAFNVTPCQKEGHTLRVRAGHCAQCNTAHLGFQKRNDDAGIIYIAGSKNGKLIKVGFTKGIEIRKESLNRTKYGNFSDWEILFAMSCMNAGILESKIKFELNGYSYLTNYNHDGKTQKTGELYRCSYKKAKDKLLLVIENENLSVKPLVEKVGTEYEFPNLMKK